MGNFDLKQILKDKNKLLMLVPLVLAVLFTIVFFKQNKTSEKTNTEKNQAFFEPTAEGDKKLTDKIEAYRLEEEEANRKKRELEQSKVRGSDFYFNMQKDDDDKMKARIEKLQTDPYSGVTSEYREKGEKPSNTRLANKMRQQLDDIEDQETFDQIVTEAQKEERIRKELQRNAEFRDNLRKKYVAQAAGKKEEQKDITPKVEVKDTVDANKPEPIFLVENGKRKRRSQFTPPQKVNLVKAAIYGDQVIVSGSSVRMRLLEPLLIAGTTIPANTLFYGQASVGASRLKIAVDNLKYGKYISPVSFTIYDSDAAEGLNLPNNLKAEAARRLEQGLLQGVQLPISSIGTVTSEVTSAITATTQVAKQIINQSLSQVKVHLKANYNLYIKEETKEDKQKREEEDAEIERLYQQMLMQQNEPQKVNPLTKLIETL